MATADDDPSELRCSAVLLSRPGEKGERRRLRMPGLTRLSVINRKYRSAIGARSKEHDNGTRMTRIRRIIADKTQKDQRQSASSASSAFYEIVHWSETRSS